MDKSPVVDEPFDSTILPSTSSETEVRIETPSKEGTPLKFLLLKAPAFALYYKSASTYMFLCSKGCILSSPTTILSWTRDFKTKPGHNSKLFKLVKVRVETMTSKERECVLLFAEMAIRKMIEFSKIMTL